MSDIQQTTNKNVFNHKVVGGILLILGTCLGGAMLALPISNSFTGFGVSSTYLLVVWAVMAFCSMLILEVNLLFPVGTNLLTMSKDTLGRVGQMGTLAAYFLLLYNLLSAYISGGSGIILNLLSLVNLTLSDSIAAIIFAIVFGLIVFISMHRLDYINQFG